MTADFEAVGFPTKRHLSFLILALILPQGGHSLPKILESQRATNFGTWGDWAECPEGSYVMGFQLKVETEQGDGDDTALNGIRLFCSSLSNPTNVLATLESLEGPYGDWRNKFYCDGGYVFGFALKAQPAGGDDEAATNLKILCSNLGKNEPIEGDGLTGGDYSSTPKCRKFQAVCAMRTQVEERQGSAGDDTALNNVDMKCCDIPNPGAECTPEDAYVNLVSCDNLEGVVGSGADYYINCTYAQTIGISKAETTSMSSFDEKEVVNSLGFSAGAGLGPFMVNVMENLEKTGTTGVMWSKESSETFSKETTTMAFFTVPPGSKVVLQQATATCGPFSASSTHFRKMDFTKPETAFKKK